MKKILTSLLLLLAGGQNNVSAGSPPLEELGQPWAAGGTPMRWEAPLGELPTSATVYRVTTSSLSPTAVSNLLELAGLTPRDRIAPPWKGATKRDLCFQNAEQNRSLGILPDQGSANVCNLSVIALPRQPVERVPDWPEALRLAEAILPKIGIDRVQLMHRSGSDELGYVKTIRTNHAYDKQEGEHVATVVARGITLYRSFEGISSIGLGGAGGIRFMFGNDAQLAELEMTWRKVEPGRRYPVATKEQFLEWLRKGKCVCQFDSPWEIQSLTLKEVTPYYLELRSWEPQQEIHPVAALFGYAQLPSTNMPISLYCPLLDYR